MVSWLRSDLRFLLERWNFVNSACAWLSDWLDLPRVLSLSTVTIGCFAGPSDSITGCLVPARLGTALRVVTVRWSS